MSLKLNILAALAVLPMILGCATSQPPEAAGPGSNSAPVRVYFSAPANAERLGMITTSTFCNNSILDCQAIERQLSRQISKLGANAVEITQLNFQAGPGIAQGAITIHGVALKVADRD